MPRAGWVVGSVAAAGLAVAAAIGLGHAARRSAERSAARFALACETAGFTPHQCVFLAELDRRSSDAADDAAVAGVQAAHANIQTLARP